MKFREINKDLFEMEEYYTLAHCISSDYALGAGIAKEFNSRFDMRNKLKRNGKKNHPSAVLIDRTVNLITKEKSWHKPTYRDLESALYEMRRIIELEEIDHLAMPQIGSGLDRLEWKQVREIIISVFEDMDIEIVICSI